MATAPTKPNLGEIAPPDDPLNPLRLVGQTVAPYTQLLTPSDTILQSKGGAENLKIYRELLRDDQVRSVWGQRQLALTSCNTVVEPGADDALSKAAAEALQEELDALNWDDVTDKQLYAVFYGWGVAEIMWRPNGERVSFDRIVVRDRARFRFDRERNLYLWAQGNGGWVKMPDRKFWAVTAGADHHDEPYGLGLAHSLYWPVFFKRNDIKFWLMFLEKFGMPTALAKLPAGALEDPEQRKKAIAMLKHIATDAGVVVPEDGPNGPVVSLLEAARTGAADYESMCKAMNQAISKIVVGQTMTTDDGSSKAQAQVHENVAEKIVEADSDLLCGSFNSGPARWWTEWNFPGAAVPRVYRHTEPPEDLNLRAERDGKIFALGYEPTEDYILETYGEGWKKKPEPAPGVGPDGKPLPSGPPAAGKGQQQYSETEIAALQVLREARRGDQDALAAAAAMFAEQFEGVVGKQVQALLNAAEEAGDAETFRRRLDELLAEAPAPATVEKISRASLFARLMGGFRAQRRAA